jgi:hypothetical protein
VHRVEEELTMQEGTVELSEQEMYETEGGVITKAQLACIGAIGNTIIGAASFDPFQAIIGGLGIVASC